MKCVSYGISWNGRAALYHRADVRERRESRRKKSKVRAEMVSTGVKEMPRESKPVLCFLENCTELSL